MAGKAEFPTDERDVLVDLTDDGAILDLTEPVPFVDLVGQHREIEQEILAGWADVLRSAGFIGGPHVESFEAQLAAFVGTSHAISVGNGTDAITLALLAAGLQPGDEVITAANTFFATVEAIVHAGGEPVLADVEWETANLDPESVERAITERTRFIVPVHLYGQPADMDPIMDLAGEYGLRVVEDNAQALGARYRGRGAGSLGHAAATSFYPGKNLGAAGDGGAVTTDDADIAERVRVLRNHGQVRKYEHAEVGFNSRLDALQAVVLGVKLRRLDEWNDRRRSIAGEYRLRLPDRLAVPQEVSDRTHTYHLFVIRDDERDWLKQELENAKIGVGLHYPVPIHLTQPFLHLGSGPGSFPVAEDWASRGLSLPMFPTMTLEQVDRTVGAIHDIVEAGDVLQSRTA